MHIVVGLSGGVDSSVVAALYLSRGHKVTCVYLDGGFGSSQDARAVAAGLGAAFEVVDTSDAMRRLVMAPFLDAYAAGQTPNPCIECNPSVKFPSLLAAARRLSADRVATGHYARCAEGALYKGLPGRDQSYMMYRLPRDNLPLLEFPLGAMDKPSVRALARELGLPVAEKKDSMDICFPYEEPQLDWTLLAPDGRELGRHKGILTLGQRRGLGVASAEGRLYVSALDPKRRVATLDGIDSVLSHTFDLRRVHWLIDEPSGTIACAARIRHAGTEARAEVVPRPSECATLTFEDPMFGGAPGQSAVFYEGERVLGGGVIDAVR